VLTLEQDAVAVAGDLGDVHEDVVRSVGRREESEPLFGVEPPHRTRA
jgi:hypothetical protein